MIEDIYNLGKSYAELENILPNFIQNPNADKVICIEFEDKDEKLKYKGVRLEDFKDDEWEKYMYRRKSSQGANFTPCALVAGDIQKTFEGKILRWFRDNEDALPDLHKAIEENKDEILQELLRLQIEKNIIYLLTIKIGEKYLKDILPYQWFIKELEERFFEDGGRSKCIICNQEKKLGGRFSLSMMGLEFCTFDKPGFAPSFIQKEGWKEISICLDCAKYIALGKYFLDEFLNKRGPGFNYYIIPSFLLKEKQAIRKFIKKISTSSSYQQDISLYKGLITKEDRLYDLIEGEADWLRFNFLIYNKPTAQKFIILGYINDVKPSWLYNIYKVEEDCRMEWFFREEQMQIVLGRNHKGNFIPSYFNIKNGEVSWWILWIRNIFPSKNDYLEVISNILSNRKISFNFLIHKFNLFLQKIFKDKNECKNLNKKILQTLAILLFLEKLNLLRGDSVINERRENIEEDEGIFERYRNLFLNNERKTAFLIGALANYVLYIQRVERKCKTGEEPFRKEFNNLLIDQKRLQKIFVKCIEKLNQYRKAIPDKLIGNLRKSLADKEKWESTTDEISYFFTLGLALGNLLLDKKEDREVKKDG